MNLEMLILMYSYYSIIWSENDVYYFAKSNDV